MSIKDLCIAEWQEYVDKYKEKHGSVPYALAFNIMNTQFSVARFYGGMTYNGHQYICENPRENIRVDSPHTWIAVERGFWDWVRKQCSSQKKVVINTHTQEELGL